MSLAVKSPAFPPGGPIPVKFSRDGENVSPPLEWFGAPMETQSFLVLAESLDAPKGEAIHWALYDVPAGRTWLPENADRLLPRSVGHAVNALGHPTYDGPPTAHGQGKRRYRFKVAALDLLTLPLPPQANAREVWDSARPHVLDEGEVEGYYEE